MVGNPTSSQARGQAGQISAAQGAACDTGAIEHVPEPSRWVLPGAELGCLGGLYRVRGR